MNENETKDLELVVEQFNLGQIISQDRNTRGLVNKTYEIRTTTGRFIVQRLAPIFDERVVVDSLFFYGWLSGRGFTIPRPIISPTGALSVNIDQSCWRVTEHIFNRTCREFEADYTVKSAALTLGRFHRLMKDCPYEPSSSLLGFHETDKIIGEMFELILEGEILGDLATLGRKVYWSFCQTPPISLKECIQLIHGDPKIDNFLFEGSEVVALIDLDTVMRGSVLLDLGDAMRSWCKSYKEGNKGFTFDHRLFKALMGSYTTENPLTFTLDEVKSVVAIITLELTARYIVDAYKQSYFGWDTAKYASSQEHNTVRAKDYFVYYQSIVGE